MYFSTAMIASTDRFSGPYFDKIREMSPFALYA
jgi:hypothetical protein